jgi:hypothetical protein
MVHKDLNLFFVRENQGGLRGFEKHEQDFWLFDATRFVMNAACPSVLGGKEFAWRKMDNALHFDTEDEKNMQVTCSIAVGSKQLEF